MPFLAPLNCRRGHGPCGAAAEGAVPAHHAPAAAAAGGRPGSAYLPALAVCAAAGFRHGRPPPAWKFFFRFPRPGSSQWRMCSSCLSGLFRWGCPSSAHSVIRLVLTGLPSCVSTPCRPCPKQVQIIQRDYRIQLSETFIFPHWHPDAEAGGRGGLPAVCVCMRLCVRWRGKMASISPTLPPLRIQWWRHGQRSPLMRQGAW